MNNLEKYLSAKYFKEAFTHFISLNNIEGNLINKNHLVLNQKGQELNLELIQITSEFSKKYFNENSNKFKHQPFMNSYSEFKNKIYDIVEDLISKNSYEKLRELYCGNLFNLKKYELFDLSEFRTNDKIIIRYEFKNDFNEELNKYLKSIGKLNYQEIKNNYSYNENYYSMPRGKSIESKEYNELEQEIINLF